MAPFANGRSVPSMLLFLAILSLVPGSAWAALTLAAEVNPDPVNPNQVLDAQITVASTSTTGSLTLRVMWPAEIDQFPVVTGGGDCPGNSCDTGEFLVWELGVLGPETTISVGFNERVESSAADGTFELEFELLEGGVPAATAVVEIEIRDDSPLELALDPLSDPVAAGGTLVYELVYGNTGVAVLQNAEFRLPLPAGTQLVSVTGGGVLAGGTVSWNLASLPSNSSGRQRVTVEVGALAGGTLLVVDAASLSGEINFQPHSSRATAVSRVDAVDLELALELDPDPVAPNQVLDAQITVSNPTATVTGGLTLRVLWPAEIDQFPVVTGGGDCPGNSCDTGEYLFWNLGPLGPGASLTVGFNERAESSLADGVLVPVEIELFEAGRPARNLSRTLRNQSDSPLEVFVDPLTDPVAAGGTLVYEVVYGNAGDAVFDDCELRLPLPAGTQLVSATGGGALAGGAVSWDLGSLPPNSGDRQRVTVEVGALAAGTLLVVDEATLSGKVNFQPRSSRATAVSRVGVGDLELALEIDPDPVEPNQVLDAQITVSNPGATVTGGLTLRVLWPAEIDQFPVVTGGGDCPGNSCDTGEYLFWNLGPLGPGASLTVGFNERAESSLANGVLIPVEIELFEGGLSARNVSRTLRSRDDWPLEIFVDPLADPVAAGGALVYEVVYGNAGPAVLENAELRLPLPAGTQLVSASGGGVFAGGAVRWNLGSFPANSGGRQRVTVQVGALAAGTLLAVDAATFGGEINFQPRSSRATAVSRVAAGDLGLALEIDPDPVRPNELLDGQITVSNPAATATGGLILRVLWPAEIDQFPVVTGGGDCPGNSCDTGEYLVWNLGALGPGASAIVDFNETAESGLADGTLIPFEVELLEGGLPARNRSRTLLVHPVVDSDGDGEADILDEDDDDDGMPDWWELIHGLNPLDPTDAGEDPDGDGATNLEEFLAGTDPNVSGEDLGLSDRAGLILPGFEVEIGNAGGATTFFSARNTSNGTVPLRVDYYGGSVAGDPVRSDVSSLDAQETLPVDVRGNLAGLPVEDGFARGLAIVTQGGNLASPALEGDYFRVDFAGKFAAGDRLVKLEDLCAVQEVRFVDFGSGSQLRILLDRPRGQEAASFTFVAYAEDGTMVASGDYFTDQNLVVLAGTDLVSSESFGTIRFDFSASGSGWVSARYTAFSLFSLELNGVCVD